MSETGISLTLNGEAVRLPAEPRTHLADFIREDLLLTGTHLGCEQGVCGACTIFVDGRPTRSCITLAIACQEADVRTVESFDDDPLMSRLRDAFTRHHGLQCGYCTPGMLATAYDIVRRLPNADTVRIRRELSGNLCRCTGYSGIVAAVEDVLANDPPAAELQPMPRAVPRSTGGEAAPRSIPIVLAGTTNVASDGGLPAITSFDSALQLTRSLTLNAGAADAWAVLSDPERIVQCVPGASLTEPVQEGALAGQCIVAIGPIKATFRGVGSVGYDHDAMSGGLIGKGRDTISRTGLEGLLEFGLEETGPATCRLELDMRYRLAGPLSQFGRPELIAEIADRLLGEVGSAIERQVRGVELDADVDISPASLNALSLLLHGFKAVISRIFGGGPK
jgi:aerobic carbon-monoxide dehydrogenase small subunit